MHVAKNLRIVVLVEDKLEIFVVDDLFDAVDVPFEVYALEVEAQFEVLVIEDSYVGLWVVLEYFDHSGRIDQVVLEEIGKGARFRKERLRVGRGKIVQITHGD